MHQPFSTVSENTWSLLARRDDRTNGFREYDARWKYPQEINLPGITALDWGSGPKCIVEGSNP